MKRILIIEDEVLAARRLQRLLEDTGIAMEVPAVLDSVKETARWLANNPPPDLIFMDIQLGDGLSFEIFEIVEVPCPVIFITAYNQYTLEAFRVNGIAYLEKPVRPESLQEALDKYHRLGRQFNRLRQAEGVRDLHRQLSSGYKQRFMIRVGDRIKSIPVEQAAFFFSRHKATYLKTVDGQKYLLDYTLEQLEEKLDPARFFRVNRQYLVGLDSIADMLRITNSRLELRLHHNEEPVVVSRERVAAFKQWLDR